MLKILRFTHPQPSGVHSAYQVLPVVAATPPQSPYIIFPTCGGEERGSDPMGRSMGMMMMVERLGQVSVATGQVKLGQAFFCLTLT